MTTLLADSPIARTVVGMPTARTATELADRVGISDPQVNVVVYPRPPDAAICRYLLDAWNFLSDHSSSDFIADHAESLGQGEHRTVVDLLMKHRFQPKPRRLHRRA
jgi:hypothetical protein